MGLLIRGVKSGLLRGVMVKLILGLLKGMTFGLAGDEIDEILEGLEYDPTLQCTGDTTGGLKGSEMREADK